MWFILASTPFLPITLHFNNENPGSYHMPSHYLIVQFQYTCLMISELLIRDFPGGSAVKNLSANAGYMGSNPGPGGSALQAR